MRLMREIRCFPGDDAGSTSVCNSWAGLPDDGRVGMFWKVRAVVEGKVDDRTGYLCNVHDLDVMLRTIVAQHLAYPCQQAKLDLRLAAQGLVQAFRALTLSCPGIVVLERLEVHICPYLKLSTEKGVNDVVHVTQSFEFSAAHRLYCSDMDDEENRRFFGKCANANGHGHNYVVEVTIAGDPAGGRVTDVAQLASVVNERVISRFDHKHLNLDCSEFANLNPSVENISRVIWNRLNGALEGMRLVSVKVWETPKTYAEFRGVD